MVFGDPVLISGNISLYETGRVVNLGTVSGTVRSVLALDNNNLYTIYINHPYGVITLSEKTNKIIFDKLWVIGR